MTTRLEAIIARVKAKRYAKYLEKQKQRAKTAEVEQDTGNAFSDEEIEAAESAIDSTVAAELSEQESDPMD